MSLVFLPLADHGSAVQQVATMPAMPTLHPQSGFMCIGNPPPNLGSPVILTQHGSLLKNDSTLYTTATKRNNEDSSYESIGSVENGAKKLKIESGSVSKVIHLRSLPSDVTDSEVIQLGMSYGKVTNVIMLKAKNQAFLEMEDEMAAQQMVHSCELSPLVIRQRIVYVQFSNHKELKTDNSPNQLKVQAVLQAMQKNDGGVNNVLHVTVENLLYPVTLDILHRVFSRFGTVLKIITFTKNNQFQALIQMGDATQSQAAQMSLDGNNLFTNCCLLRVEYSKLTSLNVRFNNDKSRDFTKPELPVTVDTPLYATSAVHNLISGTGGIVTSPFTIPPSLSTPIQPAPLASVATHPTQSPLAGATIQPSLAAMMAAPLFAAQSPVLHVSNLNEEMVTPQVLFILFGVYGDVMRVKILYQKMSNALIQMADPTQAQLALTYLQGVSLFGRPLQIALSRHAQVQMPKEGLEMAKLTQDYTNSPLHRFKKPGSKNYHNIFPPSEVLHLSNIPHDIGEDFIRDAFSKEGTIQAFKFFAKDRKMALIKMSSVEEAIKSLISLHNLKLNESSHLRVSFSKGQI